MRTIGRWLRGALGTGLIWAALWIIIGVLIMTGLWLVDPDEIGNDGPSHVLPILGIVGFLSGLGFAAMLSLAERRHSFRELSLGRVALWGMLGSAGIPLLMGTDGSTGWLTGTLGALFAAGSVAIARRGAQAEHEPAVTASS
jgi:hypothetical protein